MRGKMRAKARTIYRALRKFVLRYDPRWRWHLISDAALAVGKRGACGYRTNIDKESLSRAYVLNQPEPVHRRLRFLDVGGRDGRLGYLLGNVGPLQFDQAEYDRNKSVFSGLYDYFGLDLTPAGPDVLVGDICSRSYLDDKKEKVGTFDVVYSNEVFEHLARPWIAAENIHSLLTDTGLCLTVVPFSQRYHESPGDYYRYTPSGIIELFRSVGSYEVLDAGFDIRARRYDWQGSGDANDLCPSDKYGAWRETWYSFVALRKTNQS
jgi:SAM-dependent methyltransferase